MPLCNGKLRYGVYVLRRGRETTASLTADVRLRPSHTQALSTLATIVAVSGDCSRRIRRQIVADVAEFPATIVASGVDRASATLAVSRYTNTYTLKHAML